MKKQIIALCLCVFALTLYSADDAIARLNAIYAKSKTEYANLTKEIAKLKTGQRLGVAADIARAEKKQQAIIEQLKAVPVTEQEEKVLQSTLIAQLKIGRELTNGERTKAEAEARMKK